MTRESKVGLLLLVAGIIAIFGIFLVGDEEGVWKSKYELRIYYDDVYGLLTGAPVRLAGLRVGSVKGIEFSDSHPGKLEVRVQIDKSVMRKIRADSEALIGTLGLLGDKTIEISVGSPDSVMLEDGETLKAGRAYSIEAIISQGGEAVDNIKESTRSAKEIIEKINNGTGSLGLFVNDPSVYFDLDRLLILTEKLTNQLQSGRGSLAKFVQDSTFYMEMTGFLTSTKELIDTLSHGEGSLPRMLNDPTPYQNLESVIGDWQEITDRIKSGEGSAGKLLANDSLYINLNRMLDRTEALLQDFRENPRRYLKFSVF